MHTPRKTELTDVGIEGEPPDHQGLMCFIYTDAQPGHPLHSLLLQPEGAGKIGTRL